MLSKTLTFVHVIIVLLHQKRKRENSLFWGLKWTTIKLYNLPTYFCLWLQFKWILLPYTRLNSPNPPYPSVAVFQKLLRSLAQSSKNKTYLIFLSGNSQFPKFRLKSSSNWSVSWKIIPYSRPKLSDLYTLSRSIIAWKPYPSQRHISIMAHNFIWPVYGSSPPGIALIDSLNRITKGLAVKSFRTYKMSIGRPSTYLCRDAVNFSDSSMALLRL